LKNLIGYRDNLFLDQRGVRLLPTSFPPLADLGLWVSPARLDIFPRLKAGEDVNGIYLPDIELYGNLSNGLRLIAGDCDMSKQNITVRLEPEMVAKLDQLAAAMQRDRSWLMGHAIERYVEEEAWQVKAIREAMQKVKDRRARVASHEDVSRWLESWGTDDEREAPECK